MVESLLQIDRRWIFLAMALAISIPVLAQVEFPEHPTRLTRDVFDRVETLAEGSRILLALDYDAASEAELQPMVDAFAFHCSKRRHRLVFLTLWPNGGPMIEQSVTALLSRLREGDYVEGTDYVDFGYYAGNDAVIVGMGDDVYSMLKTDARGKPAKELPIMRGVEKLDDFQLIVSFSAGQPGTKEWVQYAAVQHGVPTAAGVTGVQAPQMYPYIPDQLLGLLAAIKGAAEYEAAVVEKYGATQPNPARANSRGRDAATEGAEPASPSSTPTGPETNRAAPVSKARRKMAPQLSAHLLMIGLIITGNVLYFLRSRQERRP